MSRSRDKGTSFETLVSRYLAEHVDERIERRSKNGSGDRGDLSALRCVHGRIVAECKNTTRHELAQWAAEAEVERGNDDALVGVVVHKRRGKANPGDQWVTLTLRDFAALLSGRRPDDG